jgi:NADH-quinone oxidoreductase subunit M
MLLLELLILGAFLAFDLFTFFVFFEGMFIPLVLIILIWGSRPKKLKAVSYLFLYTLFGSVFFLTGILYLYAVFGTTNYFYLLNNIHVLTSAQSGFL